MPGLPRWLEPNKLSQFPFRGGSRFLFLKSSKSYKIDSVEARLKGLIVASLKFSHCWTSAFLAFWLASSNLRLQQFSDLFISNHQSFSYFGHLKAHWALFYVKWKLDSSPSSWASWFGCQTIFHVHIHVRSGAGIEAHLRFPAAIKCFGLEALCVKKFQLSQVGSTTK